MAKPRDLNNIIVKDTIEAWQPFYRQKLTDNDATEIQKNLVNFMNLLNRWNERKKPQLLDNNLIVIESEL